jgi:16S rRNA (cytidine1402-2'-O)-methyltransferase
VQACVAGGGTVAVVSDAGTPGISDPGTLLVSRLSEAGEEVSIVPGPTSVVAALVISGLPTDRFCVEGFLPRKGGERRDRVAALMADGRTTVVLEAPGRLAATLAELAAVDAARRVVVVRELTKVHEEVWRGTLGEAAEAFGARQVRGEVVVVIAGATPAGPPSDEAIDDAVRERLRRGQGEGPRQIALVVSEELGVPRRTVYETVLRLRTADEARPEP